MLSWYNQNGEAFIRDTLGVDMSRLYVPFLKDLPPGARLLDAGCGSGRDTLAFRALGFDVVALDASSKIVELTSALLGEPVCHLQFQELDWEEAFDGIWACASLLHVPRAELPGVLRSLARALRPGGVLYASFKEGEGEHIYKGRFFCDLQASELAALLRATSGLEEVNISRSVDLRPGREREHWLNALARKEHPASSTGA